MELHGLGLLVYEVTTALGKSFSTRTQLTFGADTLGSLSVEEDCAVYHRVVSSIPGLSTWCLDHPFPAISRRSLTSPGR